MLETDDLYTAFVLVEMNALFFSAPIEEPINVAPLNHK